MSAVEAILSFDGKQVDELKAAIATSIGDNEWAEIASFFDHDEVKFQVASTWLVKNWLDLEKPLPTEAVQQLLASTQSFVDWEPRLHFFQSVRLLTLSKDQTLQVLSFAQECEKDSKVLVRVWALDVFVRLSASLGENLDLVRTKLAAAGDAKAASMRARARNLCAEYPDLAS